MRKKKIIFLLISTIILFMYCKKTNRENSNDYENSCLPAFIWINYVGITNKIKPFILIRTSENDSSFLSYYNNEWRGFENDTLFFDIYCKSYIVDMKQFKILKDYLMSHNTYKSEEFAHYDYNTAKVAVIDKCDSIEYIVNCEDAGFFENMIDSIKINNKSLIESLEYYERIIHTDSVDIQRIRSWNPQYNSSCSP